MLESLFNKVAGLQTCNFITKGLQHRCFSVNIAKLSKMPFNRIPPVAASIIMQKCGTQFVMLSVNIIINKAPPDAVFAIQVEKTTFQN